MGGMLLRCTGLTVLVVVGCDATTVGPPVAAVQDSELHPWAIDTARLIDAHREGLGCEPLRWHGAGAEAAEAHARRMSDEHFFDHVAPDGTTFRQRLNRAGIVEYRQAAEIIAAGQADPSRVLEAWIGSEDHRRILEDCGFTEVGVGFHEGAGPYRTYWVALFFSVR